MSFRNSMMRGVGITISVACLGLAQPGEAQSEAQGTTPSLEEHDAEPALRARLERSVELGQAMLDRHREALTRLNAGESPSEVIRSLRAGWGPTARQAGPPPQSAARSRPGRESGPARRTTAGDNSISPEARVRLRAFLRERLPGVERQLAMVESADHQAAAQLFDRLVPQLREIAADLERDPAFGLLRLDEMRAGLDVVGATQRVRALEPDAPPEERAEAEGALRAAIAARFDARIRLRQHELERLAKRIGELNDQIKDEQNARDEEIERVYQAVLKQRWASPADRDATRRPG